VNEQERDAEARTACGKESLSSLGKAASHRQRSYGEEGADDRRSASKGEKEGTKVSHRLLLYVEDERSTGSTAGRGILLQVKSAPSSPSHSPT
jgi:hypothetical protein